jgi:hypothetical protein
MIIVGTFLVLSSPVFAIVALLVLAEVRQRAQSQVIARQILLTDAIHAELGAVVAPVVEKRTFRPWRVTFPGAGAQDVGRLLSITDRVLGSELEILFTRAA